VVASMWEDGICVCFLFCFYSHLSLVGTNTVGACLAFFFLFPFFSSFMEPLVEG